MSEDVLASFHQPFFTKPPIDKLRSKLFEYGIGHQHLMDWLLIAPECKGDSELANFYVSKPTPNLAIELLRHPQETSRYIGVKIVDPISLMRKYLPEAVGSIPSAGMFVALADRWFLAESDKQNGVDAIVEAQAAALVGHRFAKQIGIIPEPVWEGMRSAFIGEQE